MTKLNKVLSHPVTFLLLGFAIFVAAVLIALPYEVVGEFHSQSMLSGGLSVIGLDIFIDGVFRFFSKKSK